LCLAGTPSIKNRKTVFLELKNKTRWRDFHRECFLCLQETVAFIFSACTRAEKLTPHLHFLRDLRVLLFKTLDFFISQLVVKSSRRYHGNNDRKIVTSADIRGDEGALQSV
jgi:hypothetical protein